MRIFAEYFATPARASGISTGLFGIKGSTSPSGLTKFAQTSLLKAQSLAHELQHCAVESETKNNAVRKPPGSSEIRKLDELSDTLCRVVDMAAFLRIAHPSTSVADAAQQVHELSFGFMSELNTSRASFKLVEQALANPEVNGEARKVGEILLHDFLKSGIQYDEDPQRQRRFVNSSNDISVEGQNFSIGCGQPPPKDLILKPQELTGVSPVLLARLAFPSGFMLKGQVRIPADHPQIAEHILATAKNAETRKKVWRHLRSAPESHVKRSDSVLKDRQELAGLAGYSNFADYESGDKMMKTSENVNRFLTGLAKTVEPLARSELVQLGDQGPKAPWDYSYYLAKYRSKMRSVASGSPTFELSAVFEGLAMLMERLYNLRLEPGEIQHGEVWAPDVKRLDVYDNNQKVGMIYCDLLSRPGKQPNPAHFTIQCSRKLPSGEQQSPIIALVCDFDKQPPQRLQYHEVQTLFHEMGHAIHSMIGRTELHNVSGTRCATDFVELPSILFEKFASHPEVSERMSPGSDAPRFLTRQVKLDKVTEYWEVWHQLSLSFLDQALHGEPFRQLQSSQAVSNQIIKEHSSYKINGSVSADELNTQQFAHFGHLVSYGATYYSYLFDKCLAAMVWDTLFKDSASWETGGEKFKNDVSKWGGGRDPQESIETLLGRKSDHAAVAASSATN